MAIGSTPAPMLPHNIDVPGQTLSPPDAPAVVDGRAGTAHNPLQIAGQLREIELEKDKHLVMLAIRT